MELADIQMWHRWCVIKGEHAACGTKRRCKTEKAATASAVLSTRKFRRWMTAHPCAWCGGWHITRPLSEEEKVLYRTPDPVIDARLATSEVTAGLYAWTIGQSSRD